uniref:Murine retrovirus integration site 1 homolog n=1 Tax=Neogobius melanostomus TaxID=47308 RepID=A0A8C6SSG8_9GOBI
MSDGRDAWESPSNETKENNTNFSEHELLDIMYDACDVNNAGEVLASTIVQYLQKMTVQSPDEDRLAALQLLLDPDSVDPAVNRETFLSKMREWISQCSQDSFDADGRLVSGPDSSKNLLNGLDFSSCQCKSATENHLCTCTNCSDGKDLLRTVAELKQAHRKLSEQNSSLLKTVTQCEDVNLQLTLEVTDLCGKLASAQRSVVRTKSLTQELEELRHMFKEVQERASRSQGSCTKLGKEVECLKMQIRRLEDKNEKLIFERTCSEDTINKLMKINSELRSELEETLVVLTVREKEITKKDIIMDKMKNTHVENHSIIEGIQSELMRLHDHSLQVLLRYDRHCFSSQSLYNREPPNHRSLKSEIQEQQHHHKLLDDISLPAIHSEDIQNVLHKIRSAELLQLLYPDRDSALVETQERPFAPRHQQQASIKQQLVNVLQELELQKSVWEEKDEKVEKHWRASEKETKQSHSENSALVGEAKNLAVVNWWKAFKVEKANRGSNEVTRSQDLSQTQAKLREAEQTISDMREQVCHLQASLRSAQELVNEQKHCSPVLFVDKATNTVSEEVPLEHTGKDLRDVAVETDPVEVTGVLPSQQQKDKLQLTADHVLVTLKKMEAMVNCALDTAEQVKESEQRVTQVNRRMDSMTQKVEEALGRTVSTERQLDQLEAKISAQTQAAAVELPPCLSPRADPELDGVDGTSAAHMEEVLDPDHISQPPVPSEIPDLIEQRNENGDGEQGKLCAEPEEAKTHLWQGSLIKQSDQLQNSSAGSVFVFPHTRSRPPLLPSMPTLPEEEEEEDSPEEMDSSSSSPSTSIPGESRAVVMTAPTIVFPNQATVVHQSEQPLDQASPRARVARTSSSGPITTVDSTGNVIDLVKDTLPDMQLSEEDRKKNLELLEQAKKASDRFLTRRGRRSTSSLTDSPTRLSPTPTPSPTSSPCASRSNSLTVSPQASFSPVDLTQAAPVFAQHLDVPSPREQPSITQEKEVIRPLLDWKPTEKRKVSSGTLTPRFAVQKENCDPGPLKSPTSVTKSDGETSPGRKLNQTPATGVAKPVPRPPTQQAPCTAEIKTIGAFPPLMRAVSWDAVGSLKPINGAPSFPPTTEGTFSDKSLDTPVSKSSGYKDVPLQPGSIQKLSKLRDEHKLMRNQSISKLPDLSEAAEQEKASPTINSGDESKSDATPNISDVMLRKLKLHRGLPGCAPPLTEKEVENAFVQLSLAYRNDNYTLEMRLKQAERERNLTEEDTEKELEEFKNGLKMTSPQWQNMEQREAYQRLIETVEVLHRLATRLSSRAEIVGAVRQEKRMNKATEVMMQFVENLKRTYEKDHAELMEFKKLANQNSNRSYGSAVDTGDDGVPRSSRSMSVTLGKALPRRRVSVAVVPKFNLLNIPGQNPSTAGPGPNVGPTAGAALPVLCEASDPKGSSTPTETPQSIAKCGKSALDQEGEAAKPSVNVEELRAEIRAELKAKIEEEAYNKGLQEGLKQSKVQEDKSEEESVSDILPLEVKHKDEESGKKITPHRSMEEVFVCLGHFCPRVSWSKRLLLVVLLFVLLMCLVISVFSFFKNYYNQRDDT